MAVDRSGACKDARIVLSNAGVTPIRARKAEQVLIGKKLDDALFAEAGEAAAGDATLSPISMLLKSTDVIWSES